MINKSINYLMVAFAFVFPVSIAAANILLALMLVIWLLDNNLQNKITQLKHEKIFLLLIGIVVLMLLSALFSDSYANSFLAKHNKNLFRIILSHYLLAPLLLMIFITSIEKKYLQIIISSFLASIFFSEIISYSIFFEIIDVNYFQSLHLMYQLASPLNPTPFMHHTAYSVFLSVAILLLIHKIIHYPNKYMKLFLIFFLISATANLFLNGGRTGQIAFILSILTYVLFRFKTNFKSIILTLVMLITIIFTAYNTSPVFHKRVNIAITDIQKIFTGNYNTSWGVRAASNMVAIDYLLSSPSRFIFGAGAGDAKKEYQDFGKENFPEHIAKPTTILSHLHNQYLQLWFDGTLFALLLFLTFFYYLFKLPVSNNYKPLLYALLVVIMFSLFSDNLVFRHKSFFLFLLIASYFIVLARERKESLKKE